MQTWAMDWTLRDKRFVSIDSTRASELMAVERFMVNYNIRQSYLILLDWPRLPTSIVELCVFVEGGRDKKRSI